MQRAVLTVKARGRSHSEAVAAFVEESVVRRELADNFCFYQSKYDSLDCAAKWARDSLELHTKDKVRCRVSAKCPWLTLRVRTFSFVLCSRFCSCNEPK